MKYKVLEKKVYQGQPVWRVEVPRGLQDEKLKAIVSAALQDAYKEHNEQVGPPSAVGVFAYGKGDSQHDIPTAATAHFSPGGGWPAIPGEEWKETIEISELYLQPTVFPCKAGEYITVGEKGSALSDSAESWTTEVGELPAGTKAEVLEVRYFPIGGNHQMYRIRVRATGLSGWGHSTDFNLGLGEF